MTSNVSYNSDNIGFNSNIDKENELRNILSTPFVNRIDKIIYFNNLDEESIRKIINNKIKNIIKKYQKYHIKVAINKSFTDNLIKDIDYNIYGARKINKVLEDRLDNLIINSIIDNKKTIKI